jgi:RNA polymerase sigma-70 factor, ECF subfamily
VTDPDNDDPAVAREGESTGSNGTDHVSGSDTVYRRLASTAPPASISADWQSGDVSGKALDEDEMLASLPRLSEWDVTWAGEGQSEAEVIAAPDFDDFYAANFHKIRRGLNGLFRYDVTHAEDISQEAFVRACRSWPYIRELENPYGYVAKIAWRLAMKLLRAQHREFQAYRDLAATEVAEQSCADVAARVDVRRAIRGLPEQLRDVAGLSFLGLSPSDIAQTLGINAATARTRLKRARDRLLTLLEESEEEEPRA